jgi:hypothetical protein
MLGSDTVTANLYRLDEVVVGVERSTGTERPYLESIIMRLVPTSTQRLAVRQAGEVNQSEWTGYLDPQEPVKVPKPGDVVEVLTACFVNSPAGAHEGRRFDVSDVAAGTTEIRLSLTESAR